MKFIENVKNYQASEAALRRGYGIGKEAGNTEEMDDTPHNSMWRDGDDGGCLGRAKGWDR